MSEGGFEWAEIGLVSGFPTISQWSEGAPGKRWRAPAARRLTEGAVSPNTRWAYSGALQRVDAWLGWRRLEDGTLGGYVAELHEQGRARSGASTAVAAAGVGVRVGGAPRAAGERSVRVLAG